MIHYIDEIEDLEGKIVLLRLDLNVPIVDGKVTDTFRMEKVIETIDFLRIKEAKIIIISHCEGKESTTLAPMWHYLNGYFPVDFSPTYFTPEAVNKILKLENKGVLMFENLRINPGEKENDPEFAKKLAQMADIYVNDAFGVSHRKHASIVGVPQFLPHYGGLLMFHEIEHLSKVFHPEHPFVFILGGAKFETKMPLIKKYLDLADYVFVGGALANNIFKEKGFEVGTSLVSEAKPQEPGVARSTEGGFRDDFGIKDMLQNPKFVTFDDVTVTKPNGDVEFKNPNEVLGDECIVDAGPKTIERLNKLLENAKTIVWNGPLGNFEKGFGDKTEQLAEIIADATSREAQSIVGGGDTLASINKLGLNNKFSFISTGGGAMLDYLVNETLPGIEALEK
jgi:phosphoglycerate kinase